MKKFIQFIVITVMVSGAGLVFWQDYEAGPIVDPRLDKYVDEWKRDMDQAGVKYKVRFNVMLDTIKVVNGIDTYGYSRTNTIRINANILDSEWLTRQTVYHEFGHNVFSLEHVEDKCIMFKEDLSESFYRDNWNNLLSKYINKAK